MLGPAHPATDQQRRDPHARRRPRPHRTQRHREARIPKVASMPVNRQDYRRVQRLRDRSCRTPEAWGRGFAEQHAMADYGGGEGEGQGGVEVAIQLISTYICLSRIVCSQRLGARLLQ
jgi:hypothetical protein